MGRSLSSKFYCHLSIYIPCVYYHEKKLVETKCLDNPQHHFLKWKNCNNQKHATKKLDINYT